MVKKLWLLFAQTVTIIFAAWFVLSTLKPQWLAQPVKDISSSFPPPQYAATLTNKDQQVHQQLGFREAAKKSLPAVVHVYSKSREKTLSHPLLEDQFIRRFFGFPDDDYNGGATNLGSGVLVSNEGYILTNYHVIESASQIEIALYDTRKFPARIIGSDPESDLAVLKIDQADNISAIGFGNKESLQVGDIVLAIGNPFGVGQTVTMGIVSALGRSHLGINTFENFIQTDAAINPGNSGGALIDTNGNLVGINSAIYSKSGGTMGIGFAIPASTAKQVLAQLITNGKVIRGWIGVESQDMTSELALALQLKSPYGALITRVYRNSPAFEAGLRSGDVISKIDQQNINDSNALLTTVAAINPGQIPQFEYYRRGKQLFTKVLVAQRPTSGADTR